MMFLMMFFFLMMFQKEMTLARVWRGERIENWGEDSDP